MIKDMISVVIPVYNAEKYIKKNIEALMQQSYKNYEVWLIDDGSTDNSLILCQSLCEKYSNINVVHSINNGASFARNIGIKKARGEYLVFIDSDDYVEKDYLEQLYSGINKSDAGMAVCAYFREGISGKNKIFSYGKDDIWNYEQSICRMFENNNFGGYPWNKIFRMQIVKRLGLEFNVNLKKSEDMLWVCQYLQECKKVYYISKPLYHYVYNDTSVCRGIKENKNFDDRDLTNIEAHEIMKCVIEHDGKNIKDAFACRLVCTHMRLLVNMFYAEYKNEELSNRSSQVIKNNLKIFLRSSSFGSCEKIGATMMAINPELFWLMYRFLNFFLGITIA